MVNNHPILVVFTGESLLLVDRTRKDGSAFILDKSLRVEIMSDDLFLKIISREIPADIVFENDDVLAFRDVNPQAPLHVLIIPKVRIPTINDMQAQDVELFGKLFLAAQRIAAEQGVAEEGYRVVMNCNSGAGQTVFHVHLHLLGGRVFNWPPG
jgi:histidine triad (HIT) family protein